MKKLLVIVLVIAIIGLSPLLVGNIAQSQFDTNLELLNSINGYEATIIEKEDSYLTSNLKLRIGVDIAALTQDPQLQNSGPESQVIFDRIKEGIVLDVIVHKGPIILQPGFSIVLSHIETKIADGQEFIETIENELKVEELFTASTTLGLFGGGKSNLSITPINYSDPMGTVEFGGIEMLADLSGYGKKYKVQGTIAGLKVMSPELQLTMDPATISGNGEVAEIGQIGVGTLTMEFPSFVATGAADVNLKNLILDMSVNEAEKELITVDYRIAVASIEGDMLPQSFSDIEMHFGLENLNKSTLQEYTDLFYGGGNIELEDPEVLLSLANDLLSSSPKFVIKNIGYSADNAVQLSVSGDVGIDQTLLDQPLSLENAQLLIPAVIANLELNAHRDLVDMAIQMYSAQQSQSMVLQMGLSEEEAVEMQQQQLMQFQDMLSGAVEEGMVIDNGTVFSLKANFSQSELTVNDKPMQL